MLPVSFSDRQKQIIASAVTTVSLVVIVAVFFWMAKLLLDFFVYFAPVFLPLAVAAIIATLLRPYYLFLLGLVSNSGLAVCLVFASILLPLAFIFYYFGMLLLAQISGLLGELPVWLDNIKVFISERSPQITRWLENQQVIERFKLLLEGRSDLLASSSVAIKDGFVSAGMFVINSLSHLLYWLVMPVYFAFLIQAPVFKLQDVEEQLPFLKPDTKKSVIYLMSEFISILVAFFRGQLVIALCQGVMFAMGFYLVGLPHGIILGLLLGLLNIVPYLGNMIGLAVVIPLAWFHPVGGLALLAGVGVVFVLVQMIEGYILTPRIMGKTTGLHPMAIIFAIFFWGMAFGGLLGMIMAIPLTAFLVVFWRLLKSRYIKEWL